ncbi:MAG: SIS domain-containing protein [Candidatus Solibacter sp.]|nr:SIS domain-containing protein [Candidatus Solibacter sp.]
MHNNDSPRLLRDIQAQPETLAGVLAYHSTAGNSAISEAAALLRSARRIVITGMGASLFASIPLEYYLSSRGAPVMVLEAAEFLHYRLRDAEGAVVLMVSRSGDSVEIARLVDALHGRSPIVGVTNEPGSLLARRADCCLHLRSQPDEMVAIQTYTASVLTLMLLGGAVAGEWATACDEASRAVAELPGLIERCSVAMPDWDVFLKGGAPVYLMGRGPSCASMFEGVLLFHETAKAPAVGMPAASFRHGPVEMVDGGFRGLIFVPNGCTRDLNLALARDLDRFGGMVRVIGPGGPEAHGLECCETPALSSSFAPLLEIVPVQFAALRLACLKGLKVGGFRYTPQVTRDEARFSNV